MILSISFISGIFDFAMLSSFTTSVYFLLDFGWFRNEFVYVIFSKYSSLQKFSERKISKSLFYVDLRILLLWCNINGFLQWKWKFFNSQLFSIRSFCSVYANSCVKKMSSCFWWLWRSYIVLILWKCLNFLTTFYTLQIYRLKLICILKSY